MNIISVDLTWKPDKRGHRALAIAELDGNIKIMLANDDNELLKLVRDNTEPQSLVLLDIPIDGCESLGSEHCRPVDKALLHQGISILPSSKAGDRGRKLKEKIQSQSMNRGKRVIVQEIYPYAVFKFLWYTKERKSLKCLSSDKFDTLLGNKFRTSWPPKYKRQKKKDDRLKDMEYLYSLLTDASFGLKFSNSLRRPASSYPSAELNRLCDEYDACLGAIVGIYCANNSSYACIAGNSESGEILLLADEWLQARLEKEVKVRKCGIGSLKEN